jgi:predicted DNA-binding transcriptional regulator AlpA
MRKAPKLPEVFETERLLDAPQMAALLGVSIATFRRQVRSGRFSPGVLVGVRARRWPAREALSLTHAA